MDRTALAVAAIMFSQFHSSVSAEQLPLMSAPLNVLITTDKMRDYYKSIQARIYGNLTEYPASKNTGAIALFSITPEGKIRDCILGLSSDSNTRDFACLEAIYGSSPLPPPTQELVQNSCNTKYRPGTQRAQIDFYETKYPKQFALPTEFKDSALKHVQGKDKGNDVVFLHLLPLDVMNRYPGLFSIDELSSSENVKELSTKGLLGPSAKSTIHKVFANTSIKQFFSNWEDFFCSHPNTTREQLLEFRAQQKLLLEK
jgi:hypothetical protein